jgi:hypothetical protein
MIRITKYTSFILTAIIICTTLIAVSWTSRTREKYTIISKNGTYHTETFRMYGKGIVFESEGEDVILMGDLDIKCKSNR